MTLVQLVKNSSVYADKSKIKRNLYSVLGTMQEELGEISTEVKIEMGDSYKAPGNDGILGEAVDLLIATLDLIHVSNPEITEEDLVKIANTKTKKWISSASNKD